jgi:hypothetical protein
LGVRLECPQDDKSQGPLRRDFRDSKPDPAANIGTVGHAVVVAASRNNNFVLGRWLPGMQLTCKRGMRHAEALRPVYYGRLRVRTVTSHSSLFRRQRLTARNPLE